MIILRCNFEGRPQSLTPFTPKWANTAVFPEELRFHHDYTTGNKHRNEAIEQPTQKKTWIPCTESGILQVGCCTSNLNSSWRILFHFLHF